MVTVPHHGQSGAAVLRAATAAIRRPDRLGTARGAVNWSSRPATARQSIDTVTVTVGGKAPTHVLHGWIQATIQASGDLIVDCATPGDLIIVPPGIYNELLLMWKPVRLQGVGAASSIINANTHPAGKLDPWRQQVVCLFGLALNGVPDRLWTRAAAQPGLASASRQRLQSAGGSLAAGSHGRLGRHAERQPGGTVAGANPDGSL